MKTLVYLLGFLLCGTIHADEHTIRIYDSGIQRSRMMGLSFQYRRGQRQSFYADCGDDTRLLDTTVIVSEWQSPTTQGPTNFSVVLDGDDEFWSEPGYVARFCDTSSQNILLTAIVSIWSGFRRRA